MCGFLRLDFRIVCWILPNDLDSFAGWIEMMHPLLCIIEMEKYSCKMLKLNQLNNA